MLIRGLVSPELPKDKTFDELVDLLKKHYDPQPIVIAEQFHFYQRSQKPDETITNYLASLRSRCEFCAFLTEALRHRLVCGMQHENIQKVLLTKAKLDLDKALEISLGMEAATQKARVQRQPPLSTSDDHPDARWQLRQPLWESQTE